MEMGSLQEWRRKRSRRNPGGDNARASPSKFPMQFYTAQALSGQHCRLVLLAYVVCSPSEKLPRCNLKPMANTLRINLIVESMP